MKTICPKCFQEYDIADEMKDQEVSCGICQQQFTAKLAKDCPRCGTANPALRTLCRRCNSRLPMQRNANSPAAYEQSTRDKKFPLKKVIYAISGILALTAVIYFWNTASKSKQEKENITCSKALEDYNAQACPIANKEFVKIDRNIWPDIPRELRSKFPSRFCPVRHRSNSNLIPVCFADDKVREVLIPDDMNNPGEIAEFLIKTVLPEDSELRRKALNNAEKYK
jgi:hypothetical protein